jgi:hypothetical protein
MRYTFRPLVQWTDPVTQNRPDCRFRAAWSDTLDLLDRETYMLGADVVVLQVDVTEADIRRDGMIRANARARFPGVRVSFESRFGPLTYATDRYDDWRDNIRAVALSLEALRKVDRYGVNKRGEQYQGWIAIEAATGETKLQEARDLIASYGGLAEAIKATHPDRGGKAEDFHKVQEARRTIEGAP